MRRHYNIHRGIKVDLIQERGRLKIPDRSHIIQGDQDGDHDKIINICLEDVSQIDLLRNSPLPPNKNDIPAELRLSKDMVVLSSLSATKKV
jgi:hypothetical protein